jgi:hypothetical protein
MPSPQKVKRKLSYDYDLATAFSDKKRILLNYFWRKGRAVSREDYEKFY